jgi:hypothetical protein
MTKMSAAAPKPPLNMRSIKEKPAAAKIGGVRSAIIIMFLLKIHASITLHEEANHAYGV